MESSKWDVDAATVRSPVANVQVMGAEFYRAWSGISHLSDADVIFTCIYDRSPDQIDCLQNFFLTRGFRLGANLARSNFPFEVDHIYNTNFACRSPMEIAELNVLIREHALQFNVLLDVHELVINGQKYTCVGKNLNSATMLFNVLCLGVSGEQIAHLKSELLNNGTVARILFDPDLVAKVTSATDKLSRIIVLYVKLFSNYLPDELMRYAAALLVVEKDITDDYSQLFAFDTGDDARRFAMDEIVIETVTVLKSKDNVSLESSYHDGVKHLDPWGILPDAPELLAFMDEPLLKSGNDRYLKGVPDLFVQSVNSAVLSMETTVEKLIGKPFELLGNAVVASCKDFCSDVPYGVIATTATKRLQLHKQPLEVFILGSNRKSAFQTLGLSKAVNLVLYRKDGELFDSVRADKVRPIIYDNPAAYANRAVESTRNAVYVIDTVDHMTFNSGRREYHYTTMRGPTFSMDRAVNVASNLFSKAKSVSPTDFHGALPGYIVMRFVPTFSSNMINHIGFFSNMVHHYDINYFPPVDFHGSDFTITMLKRAKPLPKIHDGHRQPLKIFQAFVMHVMAVRVGVLRNILNNRFSWRVLLPIRLVARMFSNNSGRAVAKLNKIVDFSTWGSDIPITEFNNLFGEYDKPGVFNQGVTYVAGTPVRARKKQSGGKPVGVSKLTTANDTFLDYMATHVKPTAYGPAVSAKPKHIISRKIAAADTYPI